MLSSLNAFEISNVQRQETKSRYPAIGCNNVTWGEKLLNGVFADHRKAGPAVHWTLCCLKKNAGECVPCWPRLSRLRLNSLFCAPPDCPTKNWPKLST